MYNDYGDEMDGFLLIDKPVGMTSHDVVFKVKKKFHVKKVGHTGTLDPFASGLLILCLGRATKLASLFNGLDKTYDGTILFNKHYDTYDVTGTIVEEKHIELNEKDIHLKANGMIGTYDQKPPMYSAIKINGQKLYDLARKGVEIDVPTRKVSIYDFKLGKLEDLEMSFSCHVSKGTYIRSLAVDLAAKLDTYASLKTLRRTSVGNYKIDDAYQLDEVDPSHLISLDSFFSDYPKLELSDYLIHLVKNGIYLDERQTTIEKPFVVVDKTGQMIAYYEVADVHKYKPVLIF